jgi:hypothetical protein
MSRPTSTAKKQTLIERVKAIVPGADVLEEFVLGGRPLVEWVFDNKPRLVGIPTRFGDAVRAEAGPATILTDWRSSTHPAAHSWLS